MKAPRHEGTKEGAEPLRHGGSEAMFFIVGVISSHYTAAMIADERSNTPDFQKSTGPDAHSD